MEELHEGDPLVVGGVGGLLLGVDALQVGDAVHVGLVLRRYVARTVDPAVIFCCFAIYALENRDYRNFARFHPICWSTLLKRLEVPKMADVSV